MAEKSTPKAITEKEDVNRREANKASPTNLEYLKEKMRERAATEVPSPQGNNERARESRPESDTKSETAAVLEETKQAVNKVAEKLEQLTKEVTEEHPKNSTKKH
jgi:hypothetical protein